MLLVYNYRLILALFKKRFYLSRIALQLTLFILSVRESKCFLPTFSLVLATTVTTRIMKHFVKSNHKLTNIFSGIGYRKKVKTYRISVLTYLKACLFINYSLLNI